MQPDESAENNHGGSTTPTNVGVIDSLKKKYAHFFDEGGEIVVSAFTLDNLRAIDPRDHDALDEVFVKVIKVIEEEKAALEKTIESKKAQIKLIKVQDKLVESIMKTHSDHRPDGKNDGIFAAMEEAVNFLEYGLYSWKQGSDSS